MGFLLVSLVAGAHPPPMRKGGKTAQAFLQDDPHSATQQVKSSTQWGLVLPPVVSEGGQRDSESKEEQSHDAVMSAPVPATERVQSVGGEQDVLRTPLPPRQTSDLEGKSRPLGPTPRRSRIKAQSTQSERKEGDTSEEDSPFAGGISPWRGQVRLSSFQGGNSHCEGRTSIPPTQPKISKITCFPYEHNAKDSHESDRISPVRMGTVTSEEALGAAEGDWSEGKGLPRARPYNLESNGSDKSWSSFNQKGKEECGPHLLGEEAIEVKLWKPDTEDSGMLMGGYTSQRPSALDVGMANASESPPVSKLSQNALGESLRIDHIDYCHKFSLSKKITSDFFYSLIVSEQITTDFC